VKIHTSAKCGKYNSQTRYRAARKQYDLAVVIGIALRSFYARGGRGVFARPRPKADIVSRALVPLFHGPQVV
jgi:hypothetical protein